MSKEKPEGEVVAFGASCKVTSSTNKPPTIEERLKALEERVVNIDKNVGQMLQEHANALNAMSMWIIKQDKKVAQELNVVNWAVKEMNKEQRLAERKAKYKASKSTPNSGS